MNFHPEPKSLVLITSHLIPVQWRHLEGSGPVRAFNPAILASPPGYLLAYRLIFPDGLRRIALCRLDGNLAVVPGSTIPLSDLLSLPEEYAYSEQALTWFADPRLFAWGNLLMIHWNSGVHRPQNHQFVQVLDGDKLVPIGTSWELIKADGQEPIEKNWGLFQGEDTLYSVYSLSPLRILALSTVGKGKMLFSETQLNCWDDLSYANRFGVMRGGAPPVLVEGRQYLFCHSRYRTFRGICYVPGLFGFSEKEPFVPEVFRPRPLTLENPFGSRFLYERLNDSVSNVVYPCGALYQSGEWLVSYGINDEQCAIQRLDHHELVAQLRPTKLLNSPSLPMSWDEAVLPLPQRWKRRLSRFITSRY